MTATGSTSTKRPPGPRVIDQLNAEWEWLGQRRIPVDIAALLPGAGTVAELVEQLRARPEPTRDAVLHALLSCPESPPADRQLAHRTVLQVMLGIAVRCVRPSDRAVLGSAEAEQLLMTCLTEVIATYRLSRTRTWVTLVCELRRMWTREVIEARALSTETTYLEDSYLDDDPIDDTIGQHRAAGDDLHPSEQLLRLLIWAVQVHVLDREVAALLARRYRRSDACPGERPIGGGFAGAADEVATAADLQRPAVRKRCSRAVAKLRMVVDDIPEEIAA